MAKRKPGVEALKLIWKLFTGSRSVSSNQVREGQTSEQLRVLLGNPLSVDTKFTKTRKCEIWKYNRRGTNRYGLRIILDNDVVVGWDEKKLT
jgi:outer membrane protein assembly factor BamE (lipoprotein component of BamABCDE complex)